MKIALSKEIKSALGIVALAACAVSVQAMPMTSNITLSPAVGALGTIDRAAETVSFFCASAPCVDPNNSRVTYADGVFLSALASEATLYGFSYDEASPDFLIGKTLWDAGDFSLTVDSLDATSNTGGFVTASGTASIYESGDLLDGNGFWSLSLDQTGVVNFSSTAEIIVPEPGSVALFGLGLIGVGLARARRNATKQA